MSQQSAPQWIWDPDSRRYYWYDAHKDEFVFQNGQRVRRPPNHPIPRQDPRTSFASTASLTPATPAATLRANLNYTTDTVPQPIQQPTSASVNTRRGTTTAVPPDVSGLTLGGNSQHGRNEQQPPSSAPHDQVTAGEKSADPGPRIVRWEDDSGRMHAQDRVSGVVTVYQKEPARDITDIVLLKAGIPSQGKLLPTDGDTERLFNGFQKRPQPKNFFVTGRVFFTLWAEPAGESNTLATGIEEGTHLGRFGERVYSKVRRFVVIREESNFCSCLPIVTHRGQGVAKPGVRKSNFSIIHTLKTAPLPRPGEEVPKNEQGMRRPIRVSADDPEDKLSPTSRLDYGKVYTVHHHVKVRNLGKVHPHSMDTLMDSFDRVWQITSSRSLTAVTQSTSSAGQPSSSRGHTYSRAPAPLRSHQSHERRGSSSGYAQESDRDQSHGRQQNRPPPQPGNAPRQQRRENTDSEHDNRPNTVVQTHVQAAIAALVDRGFSQDRAIEAVRKKLKQQRDDAIEEESSASGGGSDSESDSKTQRSTRSTDQQRMTGARSRSPQRQSQAQGQNSSGASRQHVGTQPNTVPQGTSHTRPPPQQITRPNDMPAQPGSSSAAEQAARQARAEAAVRAEMSRGYSREQAIERIRRRLERNTQ